VQGTEGLNSTESGCTATGLLQNASRAADTAFVKLRKSSHIVASEEFAAAVEMGNWDAADGWAAAAMYAARRNADRRRTFRRLLPAPHDTVRLPR
jgi:hypothetical protein